ncbi:MAG: hypothetical protein KTR31_02130 [Myxococcales bacterium]|nr:hypothetical protein [Myxococcales bacterium]
MTVIPLLVSMLQATALGVETQEAERSSADDATPTEEPARKRFFFATSAFMLANAVPMPDPPGFAQLDFGVRLTDHDTVSVQAITWKYHAPLGIPYGPDYGKPHTFFPGHVRDYGVGLAYQRYLWKGLFAQAHATPFLQQYFDPQGELIQTGFQLFLTGRVGYHIDFWKKRLFVEPSIACTAWPVNTNLPSAFQALEDEYPSVFLLEPGFHVGVSFD